MDRRRRKYFPAAGKTVKRRAGQRWSDLVRDETRVPTSMQLLILLIHRPTMTRSLIRTLSIFYPVVGMGKPGGSGSNSKSAFRRALSKVRTNRQEQGSAKKASGGSRSKKRSSVKKKPWKDKLYTRCAPSIIVDLLEDLGEQQRRLVEEMGFQGLYSLKLHKLNKPIGAWLLSKFDAELLLFFAGTSMSPPENPQQGG